MRYNSTALRLLPDDDMQKHEEVLVSLRRLIRATDLNSKRLSKATGLTSPQLLIMQTIREAVEITAGDLARQVNLSQATITNILDRIEKRGWVVRQRSEKDKRKVYASLTAEGLSKVQNAPTPQHKIRLQSALYFRSSQSCQILSDCSTLKEPEPC